MRDLPNVANTEYALEVLNKADGEFVRQIDIYQDFETAYENIETYKEEIEENEFLSITYIDYDENENELRHGDAMFEYDREYNQ